MATSFDWRALPFREIWCVDTEFYPGDGLGNGGRKGDASTPLCVVAKEMRTGRIVQQWGGGFTPSSPYSLGADSLVIGYNIAAEFGCHIALGWPKPAFAFDPYIEFRHLTNDARVVSGDRERGFYSLAGALRYFGDDGIDVAHKRDMRDRILLGPPFSDAERAEILEYCLGDVLALERLVPFVVPTVRSLPHAHFRAEFQWALAQQERRGVPLDLDMLERLRDQWTGLRLDLVRELDKPFGVYEIVDGSPHWRDARFERFVKQNRLPWPVHGETGRYDLTSEAFDDMAAAFPALNPLRELRASLSQLRLHGLHVGRDGRNRAMLSPYGTKTGRNAPRASQYIFGPAKWSRFLISPPRGLGLSHRDFCQQEVKIAAFVSGDAELLAACQSGDVYLAVAKQLGFAPADATAESHADVRNLFKTVVLGISYGLGPRSLAARTGVSVFEAREILARLRARFRRFEEYMAAVADRAGLNLELATPFDWRMKCPPGTNPRTIRNFPMQAAGAEILHVASVLAERRGVRIVAPVHDAFMIEAPEAEVDDASRELDRLMRDASRVVLQGFELDTDEQIIRPGERYYDKRGAVMWETVLKLLDREGAAAA